jgi:tRNA uracil 4-sulfurtransferase
MYNYILLRYGEIFLKGRNRGDFVNKLIGNIKRISGKNVKKLHNRLYLDHFEGHSVLKKVFGLLSYSPCIKLGESWDVEVEEIKEGILRLMKSEKGTFKVETKRSDKRFLVKSPDLNRILGEYLESETELEFDFKSPGLVVGVEINQSGVFLYKEKISCFGGLPVGSGEKVMLLLEGEESVLSGLLMMKRGCELGVVSFEGRGIGLLQEFSPKKIGFDLVKDYGEIGEIMKRENCLALTVGETLDNFDDKDFGVVVYRPLIAYTNEDIKKELKEYKDE